MIPLCEIEILATDAFAPSLMKQKPLMSLIPK